MIVGMPASELELITSLGAHDAVLDDLDKRIAAAEARIPASESALAAARSHRETCAAALKASKEAERVLSRDVRQYEQRAAGATRALEGGFGDADAAQRQLDQVREILDDLETRQLEQMEATEAASEALAASETGVTDALAALQAAQDQVPGIVAGLRSERAAEQLKRDAVWEPIPTEVKNRYALVRRKRKVGVALLVDGYCSPCRRKLPLSEASDIRRGFLRSCPSCGRYLVLPGE